MRNVKVCLGEALAARLGDGGSNSLPLEKPQEESGALGWGRGTGPTGAAPGILGVPFV